MIQLSGCSQNTMYLQIIVHMSHGVCNGAKIMLHINLYKNFVLGSLVLVIFTYNQNLSIYIYSKNIDYEYVVCMKKNPPVNRSLLWSREIYERPSFFSPYLPRLDAFINNLVQIILYYTHISQ